MTLAKAQELTARLDQDMFKRWRLMFNRVWDVIAVDCLAAMGADGGGSVESATMTAAQVRELCADADRPMYDGGDKIAAAAFNALTRTNQEAVLTVVFPPGKTYGY